MENKTVRTCLTILVAVVLLAGTFAVGFGVASVIPHNPVREALGYDSCTDASASGTTGGSTASGQCLDYTSATTPDDLKTLFDEISQVTRLVDVLRDQPPVFIQSLLPEGHPGLEC